VVLMLFYIQKINSCQHYFPMSWMVTAMPIARQWKFLLQNDCSLCHPKWTGASGPCLLKLCAFGRSSELHSIVRPVGASFSSILMGSVLAGANVQFACSLPDYIVWCLCHRIAELHIALILIVLISRLTKVVLRGEWRLAGAGVSRLWTPAESRGISRSWGESCFEGTPPVHMGRTGQAQQVRPPSRPAGQRR
jgi:hypothetical protein